MHPLTGCARLARWSNTNGAGMDMLRDSIMKNHMGQFKGRWHLAIRSYRSNSLALNPSFERSMWSIHMADVAFVLIEDPTVASRAEQLSGDNPSNAERPPHFRNTLVTVTPPNSLEQLLNQTKAPWSRTTQPLIVIDGAIFTLGTDWVIRAGNVVMPGGLVKGLLLEAEYLPLANRPPGTASGQTAELFSNLLTSLLPVVPDAKTVAVSVSDHEWYEVLGPGNSGFEDEVEDTAPAEDDDVYAYGYPSTKDNDEWAGVDRDRKSAFMIHALLRTEGLL
ncbi:hypothetical protein AURDEDRAFT_80348 [Auricularia subglabra TFB-10046 SS5]|nr:hypothetical protein AURDEDRAFT_80348 [Auricularia subglabra TFB-10046 SS5]